VDLDVQQLMKAVGEAPGEDLLVLAALACQQAGKDGWQAFRQGVRDILPRTPAAGSVIVLINNLSVPRLSEP